MAFEQRDVKDYFSTSLIVQAAITDTTMRASLFAGLPTDYGSKYLPLILHDDAQGLYEIVAVVAHSSSSDTVTVVRGREGTTARAWQAGTRVECAPARYDMLMALTSTTLPPDPYIGMRVSRLDKLDVVERANGTWGPSVGVAMASDVGPNMAAAQPPAGAALLMRAQYVAPLTTDSTGKTTVNWKTAFPNNCLGAWACSVDNSHIGPYVISAVSATACTLYVFNGSATFATQTNASFMLYGIGW